MAHRLTHDIRINNRLIKNFYSITINKDINELTDSGKIVVPGYYFNRDVPKNNIVRGQSINVRLGYDGNNRQEFRGFVSHVGERLDRFEIEFQDYSFALKQRVEPFQWIPQADYDMLSAEDRMTAKPSPVTLREIIEYLLEKNTYYADGAFTFDGRVYNHAADRSDVLELEWTSFTIGENETAYDVIQDIKQQRLALFHFVSSESSGEPLDVPIMRVGMFYLNQERIASSEASFDMGRNIFSVSRLRHVWADRDGVEVIVSAKETASGESVEGRAVSENYAIAPDAKTLRVNLPTKITEQEANELAERVVNQHSYNGLKGSFKAKLLPYCTVGYKINVFDPYHPDTNPEGRTYENSFGGSYICNKINLSVDRTNGSRRDVGLGTRIG